MAKLALITGITDQDKYYLTEFLLEKKMRYMLIKMFEHNLNIVNKEKIIINHGCKK